MNILFLEDKLDILMVVKETLIDEDISTVFCSQTIAEAEDVLKKEQVDLVIIDYSLGEETGLQFFEAHKNKELPFILATGYKIEEEDDPILKQFMAYEKSAVVLKPYDCKTLRSTIKELAGSSEVAQYNRDAS